MPFYGFYGYLKNIKDCKDIIETLDLDYSLLMFREDPAHVLRRSLQIRPFQVNYLFLITARI